MPPAADQPVGWALGRRTLPVGRRLAIFALCVGLSAGHTDSTRHECQKWGGVGGLSTAAVAGLLRNPGPARLCFALYTDTTLTEALRVPFGKSLELRASSHARQISAAALTERALTLEPGSALTLRNLTFVDAAHGVVGSKGGAVRAVGCTFANNSVGQHVRLVQDPEQASSVWSSAVPTLVASSIAAYAGAMAAGAGGAADPSKRGFARLRAGATAGVALWPSQVDAGHNINCQAPDCREHLAWSGNQTASFCTTPCATRPNSEGEDQDYYGSSVSNCGHAACSGAAFNVEAETLQILDSSFDSNFATNGGAIYWSGNGHSGFKIEIDRSNFTSNRAQDSTSANTGTGGGRGGAIFIANAPDGPDTTSAGMAAHFDQLILKGNVAISRSTAQSATLEWKYGGFGGAIFVQDVGMQCETCTFEGNGAANMWPSVPASGGAVALVNYNTSTSPPLRSRFDSCTFTRNDAEEGAAIFSGDGDGGASKLAIVDSSFSLNAQGNVLQGLGSFGSSPNAKSITFSSILTLVKSTGLSDSDFKLIGASAEMLTCASSPQSACDSDLLGDAYIPHAAPHGVEGLCWDCSGNSLCAGGQTTGVSCTEKNKLTDGYTSEKPCSAPFHYTNANPPTQCSDCTSPSTQACDSLNLCQDDCTPNNNTYTCAPGHFGLKCERCDATVMCNNRGSCAGAYPSPATNGTDLRCICDDGYSGNNCEIDIDECASAPCQHGGTCHDSSTLASVAPGQFQCTCTSGWTGVGPEGMCDTKMNVCASNPCLNGGGCLDSEGLEVKATAQTAGYGLACNVRPDPPPVKLDETSTDAAASAGNTSAGSGRRRAQGAVGRTPVANITVWLKGQQSQFPFKGRDSSYGYKAAINETSSIPILYDNSTAVGVADRVPQDQATNLVALLLEYMGYDIIANRPLCEGVTSVSPMRQSNNTVRCNDQTAAALLDSVTANITDGTPGIVTATKAQAWFSGLDETESWAKDQLTLGCKVTRTDTLYLSDPNFNLKTPEETMDVPFEMEHRQYVQYTSEGPKCEACYTLVPVGDFTCECWRSDGWGWRPEEGSAFGEIKTTAPRETGIPYEAKLRDPPLKDRVGKDTCVHKQDKCNVLCTTTDSGCKKPSLQTEDATKNLASSYLESPCLNDATCATEPGASGATTFICTCKDGYSGTFCNTCDGFFEIRCDDKYVVVGTIGGVMLATMMYIAQTKAIMGNCVRRVKSCAMKIGSLASNPLAKP